MAGATLFVGSSSIRYWEVAQACPALRTIRRGYGGSHVSDTIYFGDNRLNLNPRGYEAWTAAVRPTIERLAPATP